MRMSCLSFLSHCYCAPRANMTWEREREKGNTCAPLHGDHLFSYKLVVINSHLSISVRTSEFFWMDDFLSVHIILLPLVRESILALGYFKYIHFSALTSKMIWLWDAGWWNGHCVFERAYQICTYFSTLSLKFRING